MEQELQLIRGDTHLLIIQLVSNTTIITLLPTDKVYFTVKKYTSEKKILFQKTLNNGITFDTDTKSFNIKIDSIDTDGLPEGTYLFDLEIIISDGENKIKKTKKGKFYLVEDVTLPENEV